MIDITSPDQMALAKKLFRTLSVYKEAEDLINIGAYVAGSNPDIDYAIQKIKAINAFLEQEIHEQSDLQTTFARLAEMF
jgi:flagellum-specific ATP synthase